MSAISAIEWTDRTWNPVRGCSVVSPGCVNCYAMKQAHRFSGPGKPYEGLTKPSARSGPQWTGEVRTVEDALLEPLSWRKPARVFVNSMSDLFHEGVPDAFIDRVLAVMAHAPRHTFQVLTKRAERMRDYLTGERRFVIGQAIRAFDRKPSEAVATHVEHGIRLNAWAGGRPNWPLKNVWLGVSAEDQQRADERIPLLLETPAAVRFISAEPLLGPVDLGNLRGGTFDAITGCGDRERLDVWEHTPSLDWVIVGGESGPGARPCDVSWVRGIVQQCQAAAVPVFVKQLGSRAELPQGCGDCDPCLGGGRCYQQYNVLACFKDRKGGDQSEWPADLRVREFPR